MACDNKTTLSGSLRLVTGFERSGIRRSRSRPLLTREGAEDFGAIVVVHYRFTRVDEYPDGRVEGRGRESKITHMWMRVGSRWQIIGGMSGPCGRPGSKRQSNQKETDEDSDE